jgi:hypothetical protein
MQVPNGKHPNGNVTRISVGILVLLIGTLLLVGGARAVAAIPPAIFALTEFLRFAFGRRDRT